MQVPMHAIRAIRKTFGLFTVALSEKRLDSLLPRYPKYYLSFTDATKQGQLWNLGSSSPTKRCSCRLFANLLQICLLNIFL